MKIVLSPDSFVVYETKFLKPRLWHHFVNLVEMILNVFIPLGLGLTFHAVV